MEMIMVICDRNLTQKIVKILEKNNMKKHFSFYGRGTANNEILSYFGLAKSEKEVIVSFASKVDTEQMLLALKEKPYVKKHGAVAFCVPMSAINQSALDVFEVK